MESQIGAEYEGGEKTFWNNQKKNRLRRDIYSFVKKTSLILAVLSRWVDRDRVQSPCHKAWWNRIIEIRCNIGDFNIHLGTSFLYGFLILLSILDQTIINLIRVWDRLLHHGPSDSVRNLLVLNHRLDVMNRFLRYSAEWFLLETSSMESLTGAEYEGGEKNILEQSEKKIALDGTRTRNPWIKSPKL